MAKKIPAIVTATTEDLNRILESHIGRLDFGRLKLNDNFPFFSNELGSYLWKASYELVGASTSEISLGYKLDSSGKDVWGSRPINCLPGFLRVYDSREEAVGEFERKVLEIPKKREDEIRKHAKKLIVGKFMSEKARLEDWYTPREIELIKQTILK